MERKGEDVRNWMDCIFIAMLYDGGGKGQVYRYPLVPWGHTPYLLSKLCTMQKSTIYGSKFSVTRTNQPLLSQKAWQDQLGPMTSFEATRRRCEQQHGSPMTDNLHGLLSSRAFSPCSLKISFHLYLSQHPF